MIEQNTDVIQGTLDLLILKTLSLEPMHGFGIARRVEQVSRGVFKSSQDLFLLRFNVWSARTGLTPSGGTRKTRAGQGFIPSRAPAGNSWRSKQRTGPGVPQQLRASSSKRA